MRIVYRTSPVVLAGLLLYSIVWHQNGLLFAIGVHPYPAGTPWTYQLWSGFVPALTILSLLGSLGGMYHLHNCHADGCWRIGKHRVDGTPWCNKHVVMAPSRALGRNDHDLLEEICGHLAHISNVLDKT